MSDHLKSAARLLPKLKKKLATGRNVPPPHLAYLWNLYVRIAKTRTGNGFGPNPLQPIEVATYLDRVGHPSPPWEFELILALDAVYMNVQNDAARNRAGSRGQPKNDVRRS